MIIEGKTKSGFKYAVDKDAFTSWRFTKDLKAVKKAAKTGDDSFLETMDMLELVLGDQINALEEHLLKTLPEEKVAAGVQTSDMMEEMKEIIGKVGEKIKN